jgi:hypothetical protein
VTAAPGGKALAHCVSGKVSQRRNEPRRLKGAEIIMKGASLGIVAAIVLFGVGTVSAQRKSTETPTVTLNPPAAARTASATIWPSLGDAVTFSATYPKQLESRGVRIQVLCYQNGQLVFGAAAAHDTEFLLGGSMSQWYLNGGTASCVADLYYWSYNGGQKFNWLASTQFDAPGR